MDLPQLHVTSSRSIVVDHVLPIVPLLLFNTVPFEDNSLIFVISPDPGKSSRVNFTSLPKVWSMIKSSVGLSFILLYVCCKICNYKSVNEKVTELRKWRALVFNLQLFLLHLKVQMVDKYCSLQIHHLYLLNHCLKYLKKKDQFALITSDFPYLCKLPSLTKQVLPPLIAARFSRRGSESFL